MDAPLEIYTNSIRAYVSLYEFFLSLQLTTPSETGEVTTTELARVRMSPQQAMALQILLTKQLKTYGEQFKDIFLPEEMIKRLSGEAPPEGTDER